jgi:hypothetical protein
MFKTILQEGSMNFNKKNKEPQHRYIEQAVKEFVERGGRIEVLPKDDIVPRVRVGEHLSMFIDPFDFLSVEAQETT